MTEIIFFLQKPLWLYNTHAQKQKAICTEKHVLNVGIFDSDKQI